MKAIAGTAIVTGIFGGLGAWIVAQVGALPDLTPIANLGGAAAMTTCFVVEWAVRAPAREKRDAEVAQRHVDEILKIQTEANARYDGMLRYQADLRHDANEKSHERLMTMENEIRLLRQKSGGA